jgi:hypothetical protein
MALAACRRAHMPTPSSSLIGEYEDSVRMAYVRGPEGIVVSLFEQLG